MLMHGVYWVSGGLCCWPAVTGAPGAEELALVHVDVMSDELGRRGKETCTACDEHLCPQLTTAKLRCLDSCVCSFLHLTFFF